MSENITTTPCLNCTFRSLIFDKLNKDELELLDQAREEIRFKKGEKIIREGQQIKEFVYVRSGLVKLSKRTDDNKERIVSLAGTKSFIGFLTVFSQQNYQYSITTLTNCSFCFIDIEVIKKIIRSNGEFALNVLSKVSRTSDEIICNRLNLSIKQLRGRIACMLVLLSKDIFLNTSFHLPLTRREMGELINVSTANVIRTLSEFKHDGLIEISDHTISIKDFKTLEKIARIG